jgi:hypothetical protein
MKYLVLLALFSTNAHSHGMNKPGPHNGHIRMIGTIHTEMVLEKNDIKVYLLDINFKNATVKNSSVEALYFGKNQPNTEVKCGTSGDHFICNLPKNFSKIQQINLRVSRENYGPKDLAEYKLPLIFAN